MTPTDYLRTHPNASTKEVMQACGYLFTGGARRYAPPATRSR